MSNITSRDFFRKRLREELSKVEPKMPMFYTSTDELLELAFKHGISIEVGNLKSIDSSRPVTEELDDEILYQMGFSLAAEIHKPDGFRMQTKTKTDPGAVSQYLIYLWVEVDHEGDIVRPLFIASTGNTISRVMRRHLLRINKSDLADDGEVAYRRREFENIYANGNSIQIYYRTHMSQRVCELDEINLGKRFQPIMNRSYANLR